MCGVQLKDVLDLVGGEMTVDEQRKVYKLYNLDIIGKKKDILNKILLYSLFNNKICYDICS